jgi:hypothetical protein
MGSEELNDRDTILMFAANSSGRPLELYFDRQTGLLLRQLRFGTSPLGLNPTQIDYGDYKSFDGVQVPRHLIIIRPNRTLDIHLLQVSQNIPVDEAKFARPQEVVPMKEPNMAPVVKNQDANPVRPAASM